MLKTIKHIIITIFFLPALFSAQNIYEIEFSLQEIRLPFGLTAYETSCTPEVSLVLSGGGARGLAQLGALRALVENELPIKHVVGTSMGSIIGGLFSVGYSINDIDSILVNTDWEDFFSLTEMNRNELFVEDKITEDRSILTLKLEGLTPVIPTSFNTGQKVHNFLNMLTINAPIHIYKDFDELLYKFRAVSTDLVTGNAVILQNGLLSKAMRASSSVTFLLAPVEQDSLLLVDGGLVANIPVHVAKSLNPDYLISVNTTSGLRTRRELRNPLNIADQIVSIPQSILTKQNLEESDIIITPSLRNVKNDQFRNIRGIIDSGYSAALKQIDRIKGELASIRNNKYNGDKKIFTNFLVPPSCNELERTLNQKYLLMGEVPSWQIKQDLADIYNGGSYSEFKAKVIEDSSSAFLKIDYEINPEVLDVEIIGANSLTELMSERISSELLGKPYNAKNLLNVILEALRQFRHKGYSLAEVDYVNFDYDTGKIEIVLSEGIIDNIVVEGNKKTNLDVIMRELPFEVGDLFIYKRASEALYNLRTTNLFDAVDFFVIRNDEGNTIKIIVNEKLTSLLRIGLKTDSEYYTQLAVDIREENWKGTGSEVGAILYFGPRNRFFALENRTNRFLDSYITYKLNAFFKSDDITVYEDKALKTDRRFSRIKIGEYQQNSWGLALGIGTQVGRFGNLIFEGRIQTDEIENIINRTVTEFKFDIAGIKAILSIDSQDRFPYPTSGFLIKSFYETSQQVFGGDLGYSKILFDYTSYFSLTSKHTIRVALRLGFADETLPLSQQFSFGGQNSFFGYKDYSFRGRQIFVSSLEYRFKLPVQLYFDTYIKARYDLGSIWKEREQIKFKNLRHGIGATLSLDTPIGSADFSLGRSFLFVNTLPKNRISWGETLFYFTIGYFL
ncbi:MAG: BamA/TamA family outer membrane protein [Bacteroidetes bacterium]|nr:BamA/TamA family outer membrane protein [Bacteroidota bacterium]